jgi:putative transcriptional regulator
LERPDERGSLLCFKLDRVSHSAAELSVKNRLRMLRAEKSWSQADLADRLGVSRQSINAIETGRFDPSLPLAFKLAKLFHLPIESIFSE